MAKEVMIFTADEIQTPAALTPAAVDAYRFALGKAGGEGGEFLQQGLGGGQVICIGAVIEALQGLIVIQTDKSLLFQFHQPYRNTGRS